MSFPSFSEEWRIITQTYFETRNAHHLENKRNSWCCRLLYLLGGWNIYQIRQIINSEWNSWSLQNYFSWIKYLNTYQLNWQTSLNGKLFLGSTSRLWLFLKTTIKNVNLKEERHMKQRKQIASLNKNGNEI